MPQRWFHVAVLMMLMSAASWAEENPKPRVAVFPLGGEASEQERERAAFSIRMKLDRQGVYEPIDGPTMLELASGKKIDFQTSAEQVREWCADEKPDLILWGQMGAQLKLHILDLRQDKSKPIEYAADINHATDVRFAVERLIEQLPGSKAHEYVTEEAVVHDAAAEKLWETNPNLMKEGAFDAPGDWRGILQARKYPPEVVDEAPGEDEVVIRKLGKNDFVLAMKLSKWCAENNGLACLSGKIAIEPNTRYRIRYRYQSDGPRVRPFIKGYMIRNGQEREIYRRQIPLHEKTDGQWVEITDELNPQHATFAVQYLRVDFYAYLHPGTVMFDDVVIKAVGAQTRQAKDEAIDRPVGN